MTVLPDAPSLQATGGSDAGPATATEYLGPASDKPSAQIPVPARKENGATGGHERYASVAARHIPPSLGARTDDDPRRPNKPAEGTTPSLPEPVSDPYATRDPEVTRDFHATSDEAPQRTSATSRLAGKIADEDMPVGDVKIPGYEVLGVLGRGGMGLVYKARDLGLKRIVALKMILAGSHASANEVARFRTEAQAVARLHHINIVQIYEIGEHDNTPYFSLEYCGGGSLASRIAGIPFPPHEAAAVIDKLARAVHAAHAQQIVHRDLKPANVLLTQDGEPKITDFGLAKKLDDAPQTWSGAIMGTPSYMAPEQASGNAHRVGPLADLYSLGAILYELLTGRPPFRAPTTLETIRLVLDSEPVAPTYLQPRTPRDLETICLKCLEKEEGRRYPDCKALADDLRRWLDNVPIQARPANAVERVVKWVRRNPTKAALSGALSLVAVLLVFGALLYQGQTIDRLRAQQVLDRNLQEAREHAQAGRWDQAAEAWASVKTTLDAQSNLDNPETRAMMLEGLETAKRKLADEADRVAIRGPLKAQFWKHFNVAEAVRDVPVPGMEIVEDREKAREAAQAALKLFDLGDARAGSAEGDKLHRARDFLDNAKDHDALVTGCYELLLLEAEAEAPDDSVAVEFRQQKAQRALLILERAGRLGQHYNLESQVFKTRRARYQALAENREVVQVAAGPEGKPTMSVDWFLQGKDAYRQGRWSEARADFEEVLKMQPEHYWALYYQALCALKTEDFAPAKAILTFCRKLSEDHREDHPELLLLRGSAQSEWGQKHLARAKAEEKRAEAARVRGEFGIAKDSEAVARTERQAALALFSTARGDFDQALDQASGSFRYSILVNRGILFSRQEDWPRASADLQAATELKPDDHLAHVHLATAQRGAGKLEQALDSFNRAIARARQPGPLHEMRADLHLERKDRSAAQNDFARALELTDVTVDKARAASLHAKLGRMLFQQKKFEEGLTHCNTALELQPKLDLGYHLRAELLLANERQREAGETLEEYLRLSDKRHKEAGESLDEYLRLSDNPTAEAYQTRGLIYTEVQQYSAAIAMYTMALKLHPQSLTSHVYRGKTYLLMAAAQAALDDFEAYLFRTPRVPTKGKDYDDYVDALIGHGRAQAQLGHLAKALMDADAAQKLPALNQAQGYSLASLFVEVMAQAEAKKDDPKHAPFAPLYRRRAVQRLQAVLVDMAPDRRSQFWKQMVLSDPLMAPLRQSSTFADLAAQFSLPER